MSHTNNIESEQQETILILDFGSQYTQLIARRIRELNVYCEIQPYTLSLAQIKTIAPNGIILSGGPASVYEAESPKIDTKLFELGIPILGICYGMQLMAALLTGGKVQPAIEREYGHAPLQVLDASEPLFDGLPAQFSAWMSHGDRIDTLPIGFQTIAETENAPVAAMVDSDRAFYGLQFHPEVEHTRDADRILQNFTRKICRCHSAWTMRAFIARATAQIQEQVGDARVLCAVSGGIDSMVLATLLHKAIADALVPVFVDNGLLRKNEAAEVVTTCKQLGIPLIAVDAVDPFLNALAGVTDPEKKRKVIGAQFIETFKSTVLGMEHDFRFLAQGTLYPDVIESVSVKGLRLRLRHTTTSVGYRLICRLNCSNLFENSLRMRCAQSVQSWIYHRISWDGIHFQDPDSPCEFWVRSPMSGWRSSAQQMPFLSLKLKRRGCTTKFGRLWQSCYRSGVSGSWGTRGHTRMLSRCGLSPAAMR